MPASPDDDRDTVELLAEEFVARGRRGEAVSVEEYAARCPDRADEIRALFPTILAMERLRPGPGPAAGPGFVSEIGPGERLGEYVLVRELGRGGMGIVFEAEQESLGRRVAVKVLPNGVAPDRADDDRSARRFQREARTAARLQHPSIVPVYAVGEHRGRPYYVMPLIPGVGLDRVLHALRRCRDCDPGGATRSDLAASVANALRDGPPAPRSPAAGASGPCSSPGPAPRPEGYWTRVARIGLQAAEALAFAHEHGILHRDIKPSNLLLDTAGAVWVADFGLAKGPGSDDVSRPGDLLGTLRYLAPERFHGLCDARSDVYALGLSLYEALTLRPAFAATDHPSLVHAIAHETPPRPRALNPEVPVDLESVVLKAIEPIPEYRYPTAGALADDLSRFLDGLPVAARRASPAARLARWAARNRLVASLAGTTLALALVSAAFIGLFLTAPPHARPGAPPPPLFAEDGPPLGPPGPHPPRHPGPPRFLPPRLRHGPPPPPFGPPWERGRHRPPR